MCCGVVWKRRAADKKKKEGMKKKKGEEKREEGKKKEKRRKRKVAIDKNGLVVACMWCKGSTRDCKVRTSSCTNSTKQLGPPPPPQQSWERTCHRKHTKTDASTNTPEATQHHISQTHSHQKQPTASSKHTSTYPSKFVTHAHTHTSTPSLKPSPLC